MANDGAINKLVIGLDRQKVYKNYDQQFADHTDVLQEPGRAHSIYPANASQAGEKRRVTPVLTPDEYNTASAFSVDPGSGFFFERVWVEPLLFALQFITEDIAREIKIWNAYRSKYVQVTDVAVVNEEGTHLTYPTLPHQINIFGDTVYDLDIYGNGPPLQDTQYKLTIDGVEYIVAITGIRIIPWDLDPNWEANLKLTYSFASTIWSNDKFKEQRRALSRESWLNISAAYDTSGDRARKIMNLIGYGKDKVFGMPIYNEKMRPTTADQGGSTIIVAEDFTYFYNLKNRSAYVIIADHENGVAEIKKFTSFTGTNQINLNQPISAAFDLNYTYVYPCVFAVIGSFAGSNVTDDFDEVKVDFKEFKSG